MATRRSRAPRSTSPKSSRTSVAPSAPKSAAQDGTSAAQPRRGQHLDVAVLSTRIDFSLPVIVDPAQAAEMLRDIEAGWDELLA